MTRTLRGLLVVLACSVGGLASAAVADLRDFQAADGSVVVRVGGDVVDPYFANKALIIAMDAGVDVRKELRAWMAWLLPRQRADGGFDRFCGGRGADWRACMGADADDATAATTIHLLRSARSRGWLNAREAEQARLAERRATAMLSTLYDDRNGLYRVFAAQPVYYLMDNIEVYEALRSQQRPAPAAALAKSILSQFRSNGAWQPAIPLMDREAFYPHALARTYLWPSGILSDTEGAADIAAWLAHFSDLWIGRHKDPFAWGIVAWNIHRLAPAEAACWRKSVRMTTAGAGWTVLDAAADEALARQNIQITCSRQLSLSMASQPEGAGS